MRADSSCRRCAEVPPHAVRAGLLVMVVFFSTMPSPLLGQAPADGPQPPASMQEAERRAEAALASPDEPVPVTPVAREKRAGPNLLELQLQGGPLMIPLGLLSLVVVAFGFERAFALRRRKTIPHGLVAELGRLATNPKGIDPRRAYRVCQQYPSAAANVICAALLKVGRPQLEIEQAVRDAVDQESTRLYANVRPLSLALAIGPLLGLLGTIWGIIEAFYATANGLGAGGNRAAALAGGIYHALITTFAGICIAIPAAILAHYFEGRIQKVFLAVNDLLRGILPQLERYEGKLRVGSTDDGDLAVAMKKEAAASTSHAE